MNDISGATQSSEAASFITRWQGVTASELSTAQSFVKELCALLGVDAPHPTPEQAYMFERPITFIHGDGSSSAGRIDCYRRDHFVLEAKKLKASQHTKGFDDALLRARAQAEGYARALPAAEGRPPFVLVVDVGNVIEIYSEFTRSGATYTPFPDPRSHRLKLADLARPEVQRTLRAIWTDPESLNPARASARVTREVAARLAELARSLEQSGHKPDHVAAFLTRSLFSMFAEDVELLPKGSFLGLLQTHREQPATLQQMLRVLWTDMDHGGFSAALATQVLKFNGKLFKQSASDGYSLLLNQEQIDRLITAAKSKWNEVEPAIFGTLLERALDPTERHALGAHYTPRAYVERLVLPTVVEPLRADWANVQAAALVLAHEATELEANPVIAKVKADFKAVDRHAAAVRTKWREARQLIKDFHHSLCTVKVLDPACGSGNFLYVTLEHLKRLEGEVLNQLEDLGESQDLLGLGGETVTPQQLLGIELNERAAALAELVLWIGYLQWHIRTRGNKAVAEPVVHDYGNIQHRDAVLESDESELAFDANGQLLTRWDGTTFKTHPVTGALVPDEAAQVPQWKYIKPRQAAWPQADFIVGNPPFIGASTMRAALGDGYVQALRGAWPEVPESADFVMYWWSRAAALVVHGQARRFGLITTNSLRQTFNRRVVQAAMDGQSVQPMSLPIRPEPVEEVRADKVVGNGAQPARALIKPPKSVTGRPHPLAGELSLVFAIADHPWVDSANGAAVRIAMTVGMRTDDAPFYGDDDAPFYGNDNDPFYSVRGRLLTVVNEETGEFGEVNVTLVERTGLIHADLSVGANVSSAVALQANGGISSRGVMLFGAGFIVTPDEATMLGLGSVPGLAHHVRDYRNGRDLTDAPRGVKVIDLFGLTAEQVRAQFPAVYQRLLERVKPERDAKATSKDGAGYAKLWWLHGKPRQEMRSQLANLPRCIATVETTKHRTFQFLDASILPDNKLIAIALSDAFYLGVLSSRVHVTWSLAVGSWLGVGNDPVYVKSRCFETFPFPDQDTGLTPQLRERIAHLAEQIDAHRKRALDYRPSTVSTPAAGPAKSKNLSLTALYNVLEALRQGRELSTREKQIHTQGLVSVLKDLHDELDAAVLAAYGLRGSASTDDILAHLVTLNVQRAAEEQQGRIRWLRPAFQHPEKSMPNRDLPTQVQQGLELNLAQEGKSKIDSIDTSATAPQPWPATLPEQVRAVAQVLSSSATALPVSTLEASFKGKGPWKKGLPRILETLEALGRARREDAKWASY